MRTLTALLGVVLCSASGYAQECLHGPNETSEQKARSRAALQLVRQVNTLQFSTGLKNAKKLLPLEERGLDLKSAPGFSPKFTTDGKNYSLVLKDTTDPCSFAFVTTDEGLIYKAQPLK